MNSERVATSELSTLVINLLFLHIYSPSSRVEKMGPFNLTLRQHYKMCQRIRGKMLGYIYEGIYQITQLEKVTKVLVEVYGTLFHRRFPKEKALRVWSRANCRLLAKFVPAVNSITEELECITLCAPPTSIFIDIEGPPEAPVEVGIIVVIEQAIFSAAVFYGQGLLPTASSRQAAFRCHGIIWAQRPSVKLFTNAELKEHVRNELMVHCIENIIVNGVSDIKQFLAGIGIEDIPFIDLQLPEWKLRQHKMSHIKSRKAKFSQQPLAGVFCPVNKVHPHFKYNLSKFSQTTVAKVTHGPHCALYDAYECYLDARDEHLK